MSNPFDYDISKGAEDLFNEFVGQCPQCGNDVMGEDGYETCLFCNGVFHAAHCLVGRYEPNIGFTCILCVGKGF